MYQENGTEKEIHNSLAPKTRYRGTACTYMVASSCVGPASESSALTGSRQGSDTVRDSNTQSGPKMRNEPQQVLGELDGDNPRYYRKEAPLENRTWAVPNKYQTDWSID